MSMALATSSIVHGSGSTVSSSTQGPRLLPNPFARQIDLPQRPDSARAFDKKCPHHPSFQSEDLRRRFDKPGQSDADDLHPCSEGTDGIRRPSTGGSRAHAAQEPALRAPLTVRAPELEKGTGPGPEMR